MVEELDLTDHDATFIADFIDYTIMRILPCWKPSSESHFSGERSTSGLTLMTEQWETPSAGSAAGLVAKPDSLYLDHRILIPTTYSNNLSENSNFASPHVTFILSPSSANTGNNISSRTSLVSGEDAVKKNEMPSGGEVCQKELTELYPEGIMDAIDNGFVENRLSNGFVGNRLPINQLAENSELVFIGQNSSRDTDANELKLEIDAIEIQYRQWYEELSKMKLEAIEATKKRWMTMK